MDYVFSLVALLVGLALGGGGMFLLLRAKIQHAYDRGKGATEAERAVTLEQAESRLSTIEELNNEVRQLQSELRGQRDTDTSRREQVAELRTLLEQERKQAEEKLDVLNEAQRKLSDAFKALAADALKSNNQSFLELAKMTMEKYQESAKGDLDKRQQAIGELVKPVKESLEKVDTKIRDLEKAREGAYQGLREQVGSLLESQKDLRSETSNLVKALRQPLQLGRGLPGIAGAGQCPKIQGVGHGRGRNGNRRAAAGRDHAATAASPGAGCPARRRNTGEPLAA